MMSQRLGSNFEINRIETGSHKKHPKTVDDVDKEKKNYEKDDDNDEDKNYDNDDHNDHALFKKKKLDRLETRKDKM
ncbi:hypothetical protein Tco_1301913 [Tanacetum coccineum]